MLAIIECIKSNATLVICFQFNIFYQYLTKNIFEYKITVACPILFAKTTKISLTPAAMPFPAE